MENSAGRAVSLATLGAALMMAHHIGAKSVRDALFLSEFDITALPLMMMVASGFSLLLVGGASRMLRRFTPARMIPASFAVSALLYAGIWFGARADARFSSVLLFLLVVGAGTLLTSGFWSLLSECFDPNTVKKNVGRVAAGGTAGVVAGGLLTERVGVYWSVSTMLPILACLHAVCALVSLRLARIAPPQPEPEPAPRSETDGRASPWGVMRRAPYFVPLGLLVLSGTITAGLIDYVFKSESVAAMGSGESLLRFFAVFNAGIGALAFLLQTVASRQALERLGIGKTLGSLPATAALGGFAAMIAPELLTVGFARAAESVFRGSFFRAGYELFYAPIPVSEKRAAKPVIDVGFDRLGDGVAGVIVRLILAGIPALANQTILTLAVVLGIVGIWIAMRLEEAYVDVLENNLLQRANELELGQFSGSILSSVTLVRIPISEHELNAEAASEATPAPPESEAAEHVLTALRNLKSGDTARVRDTLRRGAMLDPLVLPAAIDLLASNTVYADVVRALRASAPRNVGQLLDRLLNPEEPLKIRRRIPRVLAYCPVQRVADGLLLGLEDKDFEVRFRCGRALAAIAAKNREVLFQTEAVYRAVKRESSWDRMAWRESRPVDAALDDEVSVISSVALRGQTSSCLEHVFALLSLVLPREPLRVAFHGLHTNDAHLRGTALEYLESVLPPEIQQVIWPHLDDHRPRLARGAPREQIAAELLQSNHSIELNLAALRRNR